MSKRQAIVVKYLGPTEKRCARIKASALAGSVTVPVDHGKTLAENERMAAAVLIIKLGWGLSAEEWHAGTLPDGSGVFLWPY
jgi:hypothetical protein